MSNDPLGIVETKKWDRMGVLLSSLCALHCLATPFITLSLPFWIYTIHYSPVHLFMSIFIIPVAVYAFLSGYRRHENKMVLFFGGLGLFLLSIGLVDPRTRNQLRWNDIMTIIGSLSLIMAHFLNRRSVRKR